MTPIIGNSACFPGKYRSGRYGHIRAFVIVWNCRSANAALAHQLPPETHRPSAPGIADCTGADSSQR
jgi:hypothetical protein